MFRSIVWFVFTASVVAGFVPLRAARAQGNPPGTVTVSSAVTGIQQFAGDLDTGGSVRWSSATVSAGVTRQFVPAFAAGVSLRYDVEDWRIRPTAAFSGSAPWRHLQRPGASVNLSLALSRTILVGVSPAVDWAGDTRANSNDVLTYGAVVSALKVFSPRFTLGGGASVIRQFYSVKTSPFVIVNWKLNDRLRIANAIPSGPLGGAGVELRYAPTPDWELAGGGVSRSDRWRLEPRGAAKGDVGLTSSIPLLARVSRKLGPNARLDLYGGAFVNNRLTVRDTDGNEITHEDYATAPALSATLSARF